MARLYRYAAARRKAIIDACEAVLFKSGIPRTEGPLGILRTLLNELVWKYSEATDLDGSKYTGCQWWSPSALEKYQKDRKSFQAHVHLEHVVPRKYLIDQLLLSTSRDQIETIFSTIEVCVVLRCEHDELKTPDTWRPDPADPRGWWARYKTFKPVKGPKVPIESDVLDAKPLGTRKAAHRRQPSKT